MNELIIEKPEVLRKHHKITYTSLTFIFWLVTFYLWQPLVSLIAWAFGYQFFHDHMIALGGYQGLLNVLGTYLQVIAVLGLIFILWAKTNQWRFRGRSRRTQHSQVRNLEVAEYFKMDVERLRRMVCQKNITLRISDDMEILSGQEAKCQP